MPTATENNPKTQNLKLVRSCVFFGPIKETLFAMLNKINVMTSKISDTHFTVFYLGFLFSLQIKMGAQNHLIKLHTEIITPPSPVVLLMANTSPLFSAKKITPLVRTFYQKALLHSQTGESCQQTPAAAFPSVMCPHRMLESTGVE